MAIVSDENAGATPAPIGGNVKDTTDAEFIQDVVEASKEQPVLVDFWAPWCGPCRTLGPIIEKAVNAENGKVKLVKINIDENPAFAGQLGVRSIPAVFAFDKGQPVDGFMGALPESQIKGFIDKLLTGTDTGKELAAASERADELFREGDAGGAAELYAAVINADPQNLKAISGLARCYLANGDAERARLTLDMVPEDRLTDPDVKSVFTALELVGDAAPAAPDEFADLRADVEANPADHAKRFDLAEKLIGSGNNADGVEQLLVILRAKMDWDGGKAKEKLLQVFEALGPDDEITQNGRRDLGSLMFN